jgi:glutathione peroxidase
MNGWLASIAVVALLSSSAAAGSADWPAALDFHQRPLMADKPAHLCEAFRDQVVLVVNTASKCAYTPQYEGLEAVYARYRERGLVVAGFPSSDSGSLEPGSEKQVRDFCRLTCGVQFPMFAKTRVLGPGAEPFYRYLADVSGDTPRWNFHNYLLDREGRVVASFPGQVGPEDERLIMAIEALLQVHS